MCTRRDGPTSWGSGEERGKTEKRYVERKIQNIRGRRDAEDNVVKKMNLYFTFESRYTL